MKRLRKEKSMWVAIGCAVLLAVVFQIGFSSSAVPSAENYKARLALQGAIVERKAVMWLDAEIMRSDGTPKLGYSVSYDVQVKDTLGWDKWETGPFAMVDPETFQVHAIVLVGMGRAVSYPWIGDTGPAIALLIAKQPKRAPQ